MLLNVTSGGNLNLATTSATGGQITQNGSLLIHTTGGASNFFAGTNAGNLTLTGVYDTGIGNGALGSITTGVNNVAVGSLALNAQTGGYNNTAVGHGSLQNSTVGSENTALGTGTLSVNVSGAYNTALGSGALTSTTGNYNTALGYHAGYTSVAGNANTTGSNNTFLGYNSGPGSTLQLQNAAAIGTSATVNQNDSLVLGCLSGVNGCTATTKIGIGVAAPTATLSLAAGTTAAEGIAFGTDTNLYRLSARVLKTDGDLYVGNPTLQGGYVSSTSPAAGNYAFAANLGVEATPRWVVTSDGPMRWGDGTTLDTNLYRSAASVLATDDSLSLIGGTSNLSVAGTSTLTGNTAIGTTVNTNVKLTVTNTIADPAAGTYGINSSIVSTQTAANANALFGVNGQVTISGAGGNTGIVVGTNGIANYNNTGVGTNINGAELLVNQQSLGGGISAARGAYLRVDNNSTNAITSAYGLVVANNIGTGTITNNTGLLVSALTGVTTAYGIQIDTPTATTAAALYLSGAGGTAASGIKFGTDTNLYRSAASTLKTDGALIVGTLGTGTTALCSNAGQISTCSAGGGGTSYIVNGTSLQTTANFNIQSAAAASVGGIIRAAASQTADLFQLQNSAGTVLSKFDANGNLSVGTTTSPTGGVATFNGNVGIGTAAPELKLHVISSPGLPSSTGTLGGLRVQGASASVLDFGNSDSGVIGYANWIQSRDNRSSTPNTYYNLLLQPNGGNVGIGTTAPTQKLEVSNGNIQATYGNLNLTTQAAPASAPTVAVNATAGNLTGNYYYVVSYVTGQGETSYGPVSAVVAPVAQQVNLTAIPTGTASVVTQRKIYRTTTGGTTSGPFYLVTTIADNTTTTYTDNLADVSLGATASNLNKSGGQLVVNGNRVLYTDSGAQYNTAVGGSSLQANTTGVSNTANGVNALLSNTTGNYNTANGVNALLSNTTGYSNTANGLNALYSNTTGANNTGLGLQAGYTSVTGNANTTGSGNTFVGYNSGPGVVSATSLQNATAIGTYATVNQNDSLVLGCINGTNGCTADTKIGIGTATPFSALSLGSNTGLAAGGLTFGSTGDTNLYRSAANTLMTDDSLTVAPTSNPVNGQQIAYTATTSTTNARGLLVQPTYTGTGDRAGGIASSPIFQPAASVGAAYGIISAPQASPGAGVTITDIYGIYSRIDTGSTGGVITQASSLTLAQGVFGSIKPVTTIGQNVQNLGVSGVTTNIGVNIQAQSGATTNIGLKVGLASTYAVQLADTGGTAAGGITFGTDTNLYRSAADVLKTDDAFTVVGLTTLSNTNLTGKLSIDISINNPSLGSKRTGDTADRLQIRDSGQIQFGDGTASLDTNLYRSAANTLKTDSNLTVAGTVTGGTYNGQTITSAGNFTGTLAVGGALRVGANGYVNIEQSGSEGLYADAVNYAIRAKSGGDFYIQNYGGGSTVALFLTGSLQTTLYGTLAFNQANPTISASSYFVAPGGAYFSSGTVYMEAQLKARGGIGNDTNTYLSILGGTSGNTVINLPAGTGNAVCQNGFGVMVNCASSETFKHDITALDDSQGEQVLNDILGTGIYTYKLNADQTSDTEHIHTGVIAQRLPASLINGTTSGVPQVDWTSITGYLWQGVKQLNKKLEAGDAALGTRVANLEVVNSGLQNQVTQLSNQINAGGFDNINVTGDTSLVNLNVTGSATFATLSVTGNVSVQGKLTVSSIEVGTITVGGHIVTAGDAPLAEIQTAAGLGSSIVIDGNDTAGSLIITTGSAGLNPGDLAKVSFKNVFGKAPRIVLSAQDDASINARVYPSNKTAGGYMLRSSQVLTPNTTYTFDYFTVE